MTVDEYWDMISFMGWGTVSVDYNQLAVSLFLHYNIDDIDGLEVFVNDRYKEVRDFILEHRELSTGYLSDDTLWDFAAHVVGLGRKFYYNFLSDTSIMVRMMDEMDYKENFTYIFTKMPAIVENPKYINMKKLIHKV